MQEYCETMMDCRRKTFARYFGSGDCAFRGCGDMCDNCIRSSGRSVRRESSASSPVAASSFRPATQLVKESKKKRPLSSGGKLGAPGVVELDSDDCDVSHSDSALRNFQYLNDKSNSNGSRVGTLQFERASDLLQRKINEG